jgi:hypothetical protein
VAGTYLEVMSRVEINVRVELDLVHRVLVIAAVAAEQFDLALQCHCVTNRVDTAGGARRP